MIKDRVVNLYVSEVEKFISECKEALVATTSWDQTIAFQNRIHGAREALKLLNNVLEDEDK